MIEAGTTDYCEAIVEQYSIYTTIYVNLWRKRHRELMCLACLKGKNFLAIQKNHFMEQWTLRNPIPPQPAKTVQSNLSYPDTLGPRGVQNSEMSVT